VGAITGEAVNFPAADGGTVFAELYKTEANKDAPIILLFHQAGSNSGEYATIAPKLVDEGFNCLAVNQRSGGNMWGKDNKTAQQYSGKQGYEAAYADMQGALSWAKSQGYSKIIAWGSSYSASLVLRLAGEAQGVSEAIAFSPGEYFDTPGIVAGWAKKVKCPTFISCAPSEVSKTEPIFDAVGTEEKAFNTPEPSVHGSSALRDDKNPSGAKKVWDAVLDFLNGDENEEAPPAEGNPKQ
jgi:dienelactone hydrolase